MSYTLNYTGSEIDDILARAVPGGALDTAIAAKQDALTFDAVPTEGSTNPAESGGIYDAIQAGGATALAAFATDTVSGDVVSFADGADSIPVKSFVGSIVPAQSGSGDPSPSNVRPISGRTGAEIYRTGVNVWDEQWELGTISATDGSLVSSTTQIRAANPIKVSAGTSYVIVRPVNRGAISAFWYDNNGTFISRDQVGSTVSRLVATAPDGASYMRFTLGSGYGATYTNDVSVNYPSTDTDYHAYNGSTILLSFGQTVYAGTLTALGGGQWQIQPTHALVPNPESLTYYKYTSWGSDHTFSVDIPNIKPNSTAILCSKYGQKTQAEVLGGTATGWYYRSDIDDLYISDPNYTTAAAFKASMAGVQILFPLADASLPDPIIVSAEDLATLLGSNTVWTDVGSVTEMEYRADTALYVQKLIGGGTLSTLSMASPSPSLSLGRVDVLAEPEEAEPEQTDEETEQTEQAEEPEQTEEE